MSAAFVSKSRKVQFSLGLSIIDLNNVPLVTGTALVKWHIPHSTAAEHRGRTSKCAIREHRVQYGYEKQTRVRLIVGRDGVLEDYPIVFEVLQEYSAGGRGERITLGHVKLNLAEYVDTSDVQTPRSPGPGGRGGGGGGGGGGGSDVDEGITRRYLMQDSKINSTLKLGVTMRYVEGTRDYTAPALRTAAVFGGIAGIISSSEPPSGPLHTGGMGSTTALNGGGGGAANGGDSTHDITDGALPNFVSSNREIGEMQDMYRRTLAASWASQPGELKADECIEDIFAGGDGWGHGGRPRRAVASRPGSGSSTPNMGGDEGSATAHHGGESGSKRTLKGMQKRGLSNFGGGSKARQPRKGVGELDEMEARDDLTSWRIPSMASS